MDLFDEELKDNEKSLASLPLSMRMRPRILSEFVGQQHILGQGKLLRRAIESDRITSIILYGPPGCGKTALSQVIANITNSYFGRLNAVTSGVTEVREFLQLAQYRKKFESKKTILLIEEIHRFNKPQQDALLPDVEEGNISLIGTTTQNPFFTISSPLLSRSQIFQFNPLTSEDLRIILTNALKDKERGFGNYQVEMDEDAMKHLIKISDGDARRILNALEIGIMTTPPEKGLPRNDKIHFTLKVAEESIQQKSIVYEADDDAHYDTISAFIKSMRGSDPDAALYWLAKMIYVGEDPRFIARRILICAAEDVGNADPQALAVATAAFQALEFVGMPEAKIPLAQAVTYIAGAPKSNAAYLGIEAAMKDVEEETTKEVPKHLRDAHYQGAKKLGHGNNYKYPHNFKDHFVQQEYVPERKTYYQPTNQGYEAKIKERLDGLKGRKAEGR
ncbi:MAG: replication-associated recombination protein A [bacterium]|nr:replication-associated recombination protein A [bacterium]